jgi:Lon protease-like protein
LKAKKSAIAPAGYALVGCEALITDFKTQDNGLLGIRVRAAGVSRTAHRIAARQLIVAEVEWLEDDPEQPLQDEDADLVALLKALAEHPMVEALNMGTEATGQQSLANQLAYLLPFAELDKIELLQLDDPQQRLDAIQALLDELQGELFA